MMGVTLDRDRGNYMVDNYEDKFIDRIGVWFHFELAENRGKLKSWFAENAAPKSG